MDDVQLKTAKFELNGETYELCCNMNVIADVQEAYDGDINKALTESGSAKSVMTFLTAMINDCIIDRGGTPLTVRQVGRKLSPSQLLELKDVVFPLIVAAVKPYGEPDPNAETTPNQNQ